MGAGNCRQIGPSEVKCHNYECSFIDRTYNFILEQQNKNKVSHKVVGSRANRTEQMTQSRSVHFHSVDVIHCNLSVNE